MNGDKKAEEQEIKLELFIEAKKYKQALAYIREIQGRKKIDEFTSEGGNFFYLSSIVFCALGNYQEALSFAKKAFAFFKNIKNEEKLAQSQMSLGKIYKSLGDLKSAELEFRDVFTIYRRNEDYSKLIDVCNQLAGIYYLQSDYKNTLDFLTEGIRYCEHLNNFKSLSIILANTGRIFIRVGDWESAEKNLQISIKTTKKDENQINLHRDLLSLGYVYFLKRDFCKAHQNYQKALKIILDQNYVREYAIYHEYSGELAFVQGDLNAAHRHYEKVIEIMNKLAPQGDMISQTYRLLADLYVAEKDYQKAFECCNKSLEVCIPLGERIEEACCYRILGQVHSFKKEKEKAKQNFEKSIKILKEIGAKYELARSYLEAGKSGCFDFLERMKFSGNAQDLFKELNSPYWIARVKLVISDLFSENQQYHKAKCFIEEAEKIYENLEEKSDLENLLKLKQKIETKIKGGNAASKPNLSLSFSDILTKNQKLCRIKQDIEKIKDTSLNILLEGETGTGKDLFAKVIHFSSSRKKGNFVVLNAELPEGLLESELFGYKKGAFTGATADKKGLLEEAEGGTLYLDEIGYLPLSIQAKFLRVIEEKEFRKIGDTKPKRIDVRIIASSNKNLEDEVKKGNFRKDLYCRLNIIKFLLPPLRERKEDIPVLARHFVKLYSEDSDQLPDHILKSFSQYHWFGNVRELENEIKRYIALGGNFTTLSNKKNIETTLKEKKSSLEKDEILNTLRRCGNNKAQAAKELNISESTLYRKLNNYNIVE